EVKALFDQPIAYILLVVFTGVNALLFFRQMEAYNIASLRPMPDFLPWLLLFLVPAVTMRALAEDLRSGTLEVVLAQPITELQLLLGKYCGQVLFLLIALAITLMVPLGLALGTAPELGIGVAQYVGAALLLVLAYFALLSRKLTARGEALKRLRLATVLLAVGVVVVNLLGGNIGGRIDLTPGRAFTLAPATRQLLRTLPDLVTIKLFVSSALPKEIESTQRDVDDLLRDYRAAGRGKVKLVIQDPPADSAG